MIEEAKRKVLQKVAPGIPFNNIRRAKYRIGQTTIHMRFCNTDLRRSSKTNLRRSSKFRFNINPNALNTDYELWICGQGDAYYLIPIHIMKHIYFDPDSYVDSRHPEIQVVSLDVESHKLAYARGGVCINLRPYWKAVLDIVRGRDDV